MMSSTFCISNHEKFFVLQILYFKIHGKVVIGQDVASESPDRPPDQMDRGIVIAIGISCLAGVCVIGLIIVQVVSDFTICMTPVG